MVLDIEKLKLGINTVYFPQLKIYYLFSIATGQGGRMGKFHWHSFIRSSHRPTTWC